MIEISSTAPESAEMVEVFSIDGVPYSMPKEPRPAIGLRFVWEMKTLSEMDAVANLLIGTVGAEAFEALTRAEGMTGDDWSRLQQIVIKNTVGEPEGKA
jgi:hypothetical protein